MLGDTVAEADGKGALLYPTGSRLQNTLALRALGMSHATMNTFSAYAGSCLQSHASVLRHRFAKTVGVVVLTSLHDMRDVAREGRRGTEVAATLAPLFLRRCVSHGVVESRHELRCVCRQVAARSIDIDSCLDELDHVDTVLLAW